jgi:hypothetical protein
MVFLVFLFKRNIFEIAYNEKRIGEVADKLD